MNFKIDVSDSAKLLELVQFKLFELGYRWRGQYDYNKPSYHFGKKFLFFDNVDNLITGIEDNNIEFYNKNEGIEISIFELGIEPDYHKNEILLKRIYTVDSLPEKSGYYHVENVSDMNDNFVYFSKKNKLFYSLSYIINKSNRIYEINSIKCWYKEILI